MSVAKKTTTMRVESIFLEPECNGGLQVTQTKGCSDSSDHSDSSDRSSFGREDTESKKTWCFGFLASIDVTFATNKIRLIRYIRRFRHPFV